MNKLIKIMSLLLLLVISILVTISCTTCVYNKPEIIQDIQDNQDVQDNVGFDTNKIFWSENSLSLISDDGTVVRVKVGLHPNGNFVWQKLDSFGYR